MKKLLSLITSLIFLAPLCAQEDIKKINSQPVITVFIHGTMAPGAVLFSPIGAVKKKFSEKTWYNKIVQKVRTDEGMRQDWPMLDEGMIEVDAECIEGFHQQTLRPELRKFAAYQLAGTYDFFQKQKDKDGIYRYFFYGHSGLLDEGAREQAGINLYEHLIEIRDEYEDADITPIFNLIGHSHGGTIALYTALGEKKYNADIVISNLILLGMPLQKHQAELFAEPLFEKVYNFYSLGDKMHTKDYISTKSRRAYATLDEILDYRFRTPHRYDVQIFVENDKKAITHHTLWLYGKYDNALSMRSKKTCRSVGPVFEYIDPIPLAGFCAPIMTLLEKVTVGRNRTPYLEHINLNFMMLQNKLHVQAKASTIEIENVPYVTDRSRALWKPHAACSEMKKHKLILKAAWNTIFGRKK